MKALILYTHTHTHTHGYFKGKVIKTKNLKISNKLKYIKEKYTYLVKPFFVLLFLYCIAIYPIIRANFNYVDDFARIDLGYRNWKDFSRFVSEYLSIFVHSNLYLTDISPLPQLIAVFFTTLSSIIVLHLFKKGEKITFLNLISVIPLGLSPYFLACLSFKFDAPYMALSILASVFPFLFYDKENKRNWKFSIITFLGTLVMCTTYQAASGIIPLMALFLAFKLWNNQEEKEAFKILAVTAISYLIGLVIFKTFIMIPVDSYVSNSLLPIKELIPGVLKNLRIYYHYVKVDFGKVRIILMGFMVLCFIVQQIKQSKQKKMLALIVLGALLAISGCVMFGLYPALEGTLYLPRVMYGFGVFIAIVGVNITNNEKQYVSKLIVLCLVWGLFTFSFTYGNVLSEQKRYIDFRVQSVVNGLNELEIMRTDSLKTIKIKGDTGHAPIIENMPNEYKNVINRILEQTTFGGKDKWRNYYFANYFDLKNIVIDNANNIPEPEDLTIEKDTMHYTIETNHENYILITIK